MATAMATARRLFISGFRFVFGNLSLVVTGSFFVITLTMVVTDWKQPTWVVPLSQGHAVIYFIGSTPRGTNILYCVSISVALLATFWNHQVSTMAPEPYLVWSSPFTIRGFLCVGLTALQDEIFHIPQAQAYCKHEYRTWDPKLTTPPGL